MATVSLASRLVNSEEHPLQVFFDGSWGIGKDFLLDADIITFFPWMEMTSLNEEKNMFSFLRMKMMDMNENSSSRLSSHFGC